MCACMIHILHCHVLSHHYIQVTEKDAVQTDDSGAESSQSTNLKIKEIEEYAKKMIGLTVKIPECWWEEYKGNVPKPYPVTKVDINREGELGWYERSMFEFKDRKEAYHLNYEGLLGYVDPNTVPSSLCLEEGLPGVNMPVSIYTHKIISQASLRYCAVMTQLDDLQIFLFFHMLYQKSHL